MITITKSKFTNNSANVGGGAINVEDGSKLLLDAIHGDRNSADRGGLMQITEQSQVQFKTSYVAYNVAKKQGGGAVYVYKSKVTFERPMILEGNIAKTGSGGAIFVAAEAVLKMTHIIFKNNFASIHGGAVAVGGRSCVPIIVKAQDDLAKVSTIPESDIDLTLTNDQRKLTKYYCLEPRDLELVVENSLPYGLEVKLKVTVGYENMVVIDEFIQGPRKIKFNLPLSTYDAGVIIGRNMTFDGNVATSSGGAISSIVNGGIIKGVTQTSDALNINLLKQNSPQSCIRPLKNVLSHDYVSNRNKKHTLSQGLANFSNVTSGKCTIAVSSMEECNQAAQALLLLRTKPDKSQTYINYYVGDRALTTNDFLSFDTNMPKGCYLKGGVLKFNLNGTNVGNCSETNICLCVGASNKPKCISKIGTGLSLKQCKSMAKTSLHKTILYVKKYTPTYKVMYGRYFSYEWEIGEYIADGSNEMRMTGGFDECASAARTRGYMYSTMKDSNIWCAGFRHRYINSFSIADWRSKTPSKFSHRMACVSGIHFMFTGAIRLT